MKILKVNNCDMCPAIRIDHYFDKLENNVYKYIYVCELSDYRKIYIDIKKIPNWCPLEDCKIK